MVKMLGGAALGRRTAVAGVLGMAAVAAGLMPEGAATAQALSLGPVKLTVQRPANGVALQASVVSSITTLSVSAELNLPLPAGQSRQGRAIDVKIRSPRTGDTVAFTVFEPAGFVQGQTYPLVLHGHGFGSSRETASSQMIQVPVASELTGTTAVRELQAAGYGLISIDQRGHGESSGAVRVMDPDVEGQNLIAILDWAEANLPWLQYRPSADGRDPRNLVVGSIGGSYGGMYQLLLAHIDPKQRLDALVPEIAPHHLPYSLAPGNVPKTLWGAALFGLGTTAGRQTGSTFDPFILREYPLAVLNNQFSADLIDFAAYHSTSYWCNGRPVATNGGPGTKPLYAPDRRPVINALFVQGMRDTLFNLNDGLNNYGCLLARGGDVRMITTQTGHNAIPVVPDLGAFLQQDPQDQFRGQCGPLTTAAARRAFLDEHLKGIRGAASAVPRGTVCLSLTSADAVHLPQAALRTPSARMTVPSTLLTAGLAGLPVVVPLGNAVGAKGEVLAGIPKVELQVDRVLPSFAGAPEPIIFVGTGVIRPDGQVELADNQVTPLRGTGRRTVELVGVGERLQPGARLALLLYGAHEQYAANGSLNLNPRAANLTPVRVSGQAWMPLQGPLAPR